MKLSQWAPSRGWLCTEVAGSIPVAALRMRVLSLAGVECDPTRSTVMMHTTIEAPRNVTIGNGTVVGRYCLLDGRGGLQIGVGVNISSYSLLISGTHDLASLDFSGSVQPVRIADHAWLGTRSMVLGGVSVGEGAVVAAGAVVTEDVPAGAIFGGIPARQIGTRPVNKLAYELNFRPNWS